jgi:predicted double-glycine peptidase
MKPLPDIRQREDWGCGRCLFEVACKFWGVPLYPSIANLSNPVSGLSPDNLSAGFRSLGFKLIEGNWTIDLLKAVTKSGIPVCCLSQLDGVGHWVYAYDVARGRVKFHCPQYGNTSQKIEAFEQNWIDFHWLNGVFDRWAVCPYL